MRWGEKIRILNFFVEDTYLEKNSKNAVPIGEVALNLIIYDLF